MSGLRVRAGADANLTPVPDTVFEGAADVILGLEELDIDGLEVTVELVRCGEEFEGDETRRTTANDDNLHC